MAIGVIHALWLRRLAERDVFAGLHSVIDLGPQDVQIPQTILEPALHGIVALDKAKSLLNEIYTDGRINKDAQVAFYRLFGLDRYESIDVEDPRATHRLDFGTPDINLPEYDLVCDFGTTVHVFNIGEAFKNCHKITRPGGLLLHVAPCFGFINHGFYNACPNLFIEIARANRYELVDFVYFDNAFVRNVQFNRDGIGKFDLDSLPIQLSDMENTQSFMTKVVDNFYRNLISRETRQAIASLDPNTRKLGASKYPSRKFHICFVFDLVFVAMRRPLERLPFVMPIQNMSGVAPLPGAANRAPVARPSPTPAPGGATTVLRSIARKLR
jgi:hypothetical protein